MSLEDDLLEQRLRRIREIEALGFRAYGQRFEFTHTIPDIVAEYSPLAAEQLEPAVTVRIAGRIQKHEEMLRVTCEEKARPSPFPKKFSFR